MTELRKIGGEQTRKPVLLVIDDNRDFRSLCREILRDDYDVLLAGGGVEGIAQARSCSDQIRVITLDLFMPDMSGLEVAGQLGRLSETENIPILIVSALRQNSACIESLQTDKRRVGYLRKPFEIPTLLGMVRNLIDQPSLKSIY